MPEQKKRKIYPAAIRKYNEKAYDRFEVKTRKDGSTSKAKLQAHAKERGESLNGFINRAIAETMKRDRAGQPP